MSQTMAAFYRLATNLGKTIISQKSIRCISLSSVTRLKEIKETKEGNNLIIEGVLVSSPREKFLIQNKSENGACALCASGLDVKHTDVLILSQFVRSDGCMLPRRITGLCRIQQKRIATMVAMAQKAGLMSNLTPARSRKDPKLRWKWKKYNTYWDETTIKAKFY